VGTPNLPIGIAAPNKLSFTILQGNSSLDLTTVSAVSLLVTRELDGSTATWACVIDSATPSTLVAHHNFVSDGSDVSVLGIYELAPQLTVPGGVVPAYAMRVQATSPGQTLQRNP
jgi:hypothetical protein